MGSCDHCGLNGQHIQVDGVWVCFQCGELLQRAARENAEAMLVKAVEVIYHQCGDIKAQTGYSWMDGEALLRDYRAAYPKAVEGGERGEG